MADPTISNGAETRDPALPHFRYRRGLPRVLAHVLAEDCSPEAILSFVEAHSIPEPNTGCWLWGHGTNRGGYAYLVDPTKPHCRKSPKRTFVHRMVCEAVHGQLGPGMVARHSCDNPPCVNPGHILPGTPQDNTEDAWRRGRVPIPKGELNGRAKLTNTDVLAIRATGRGSPVEPICDRYGISASLVRQIRRGIIWSHITYPQAGG